MSELTQLIKTLDIGDVARHVLLEALEEREAELSQCDDRPLSLLSHYDLTDRLNCIAALCRKHKDPASNIGAHALAGKILKIVEGDA